MKINQTIQTEEGTVQFQGELSGPELDIVLEAGLGILLRMGVLKTVKVEESSHTVQ